MRTATFCRLALCSRFLTYLQRLFSTEPRFFFSFDIVMETKHVKKHFEIRTEIHCSISHFLQSHFKNCAFDQVIHSEDFSITSKIHQTWLLMQSSLVLYLAKQSQDLHWPTLHQRLPFYVFFFVFFLQAFFPTKNNKTNMFSAKFSRTEVHHI